jgi:hypothetical protein
MGAALVKGIEELALSVLSPPHHGPLPRITAHSDGITVRQSSQREFCNTIPRERSVFWAARPPDELTGGRDQLWAEAAAIEATGIPLVLPEQLWKDAVAAQDKRLEQDPWDDTLSDIQGADYRDETGKWVEWVKAQQVLAHIEIPAERARSDTYKRLKSVMKRLGWTDGRHYFGGDTQLRGYYRAPPDGRLRSDHGDSILPHSTRPRSEGTNRPGKGRNIP